MVGVSKFYDKKPVLKDIYLSYFYGAKIGVIGLNGSGKSSLLRILAGVDKDFNGETVISPGFTVGYLEQEPLIDDTRTVREVVEEAVKETVDLLKESVPNEQDRAWTYMYIYEGKSQGDIAREFGVPRHHVQVAVRRTLNTLKAARE